MRLFLKPLLFLLFFVRNVHLAIYRVDDSAGAYTQNYVFWPNATIPFYIVPEHFDREQSTSIMTTLALFAFKSCLKFLPVLAPPEPNQHVLVIANPDGVRQCSPTTTGHKLDLPHTVIFGYDCLRPPHIEMMLMKALGFPFEHNRASRDLHIEVQFENVDPSFMEMFTKDNSLPLELRSLAYDVDSVMHFGERDYSKNGHRTIIFKDQHGHPVKQNRVGLTALDLRKIEIVYGSECRKRDRQEKIEICQNYPGGRRKREVTEIINLRVNRDITPPPKDDSEHVNNSLRELGIENEVQDVVDQVYKVSAKALSNARSKFCNGSKTDLRASEDKVPRNGSNDILGIIETIADYAKNMVDNAVANLTEFCRSSENIELYQLARARCSLFGGRQCPEKYRSTKSGPVRYSTQHRPVYFASTKNDGRPYKAAYVHRAVNDTELTTVSSRRKRHAAITEDKNKTEVSNARKDEEATTVRIHGRSDNETNSEVGKSGNPSNIVLRSNTGKPVVHRRKSFKLRQKPRSPREWDDSKMSMDFMERDRKQRIRPREKQIVRKIKSQRDRNRQKSRESAEESLTLNIPLGPKSVQLPKEDQEYDEESPTPNLSRGPKHERLPKEVQEYDEESPTPNLSRGPKHERLPKEDQEYDEESPTPNLSKGPKHERLPKEDQEYDEESPTPNLSRGPKNVRLPKKDQDSAEENPTPNLSRDPKPVKLKEDQESTEDSPTPNLARGPKHKRLPKEDQDSAEENPPPNLSRDPKPVKLKEDEETPTPPLRTVHLSKENQEFYDERKWPGGVVPYILNEDTNYDINDVRHRLAEVITILKRKTCVRMKEITEQEAEGYEDYLVVDTSADFVTGKVGGRQNFGSLELYRGGQHRQHAAMMVMAMLGFYFELARHDRDQYVRVHLRHVRPDKLHHFEKIRSDATFPLPYDYESATHPAWQFWRKLGIKGISTVATFKSMDPNGDIMKTFGQHEKLLSDIDIVKINTVYGTECFQNARLRLSGKRKAPRKHRT